jgi:hypothetical protein
MPFCALAFHLQIMAPTEATADHGNGRRLIAQPPLDLQVSQGRGKYYQGG